MLVLHIDPLQQYVQAGGFVGIVIDELIRQVLGLAFIAARQVDAAPHPIVTEVEPLVCCMKLIEQTGVLCGHEADMEFCKHVCSE
jgi:hypothetical protein